MKYNENDAFDFDKWFRELNPGPDLPPFGGTWPWPDGFVLTVTCPVHGLPAPCVVCLGVVADPVTTTTTTTNTITIEMPEEEEYYDFLPADCEHCFCEEENYGAEGKVHEVCCMCGTRRLRFSRR